jgi:hypothetical protein
MTCRGYDAKAVKINKSVKRLAATILDNHLRGAFIKDYVRVEQNQSRSFKKGTAENGSKE